jgi:hypothetical protein
VTFIGIAAEGTNCVIDSNTQVTATFPTGVPTSDLVAVPELRLIDTIGDDDIEMVAIDQT